LRRNPGWLHSAAAVAAAFVAATAVSVWQAVNAREAQQQAEADRDRAEIAERQAKTDQDRAHAAERLAATEADIAKAVNDFLQADLLGQAAGAPHFSPEIGGTPYLTVKEALDRAAARIDQRLQNQPVVEAAIRTTLGAAYDSLHDRRLAVPHLERAVALRKAHLGPDHPDTLRSMDFLATACSWVGRHPDAVNLRQQTLETRRARLGPDHPETLSCVRSLALAYQFAGQLDSCARLLEQVLEKYFATNGPLHPATLEVMQALAWTYALTGRLADSLALHEKVHAARLVAFGPDHDPTWGVLVFSQVCQWAGRLDQADRLLRDALEQYRKRDDSLASRAQKANTLGWLALNLLLQEQYAEAEPLAREAVATFAKQDPDSARHYYWVSLLGAVLSGRQKYDEAEPLLVQGYQGLKQREAQHPGVRKRLREAGQWIVQFYEVTGQQEKARLWREKLTQP
jgi:tetratricopeptide (TPR) repeat protein